MQLHIANNEADVFRVATRNAFIAGKEIAPIFSITRKSERTMRKNAVRNFLKTLLKPAIGKFFKLLLPFYQIRNQVRCKKPWVIVLGSRFYTRELVEQLAIHGYRVFLFDSSPEQSNWRFACRTEFVDVYDKKNIPTIIQAARKFDCRSVLMPQDDNLIPVYAEVNRQLKNDLRFSPSAVEASLSKTSMRRQLADAGLKTAQWKTVTDIDELTALPFPAIVKPPMGQGSQGVRYVKNQAEATAAVENILEALGQDHCVVEEYLDGRQFDVEGVISNGTPVVHLITEECYTDFLPEFSRPSWYLHGLSLPTKLESEILRETKAALAACDLYSGAFHLELKFKGDQAMTIDLANRMGADFFKYARLVTDVPVILEYLKTMTCAPVRMTPLSKVRKHPILRFYNYVDHPAHHDIQRLAFSMADDGDVALLLRGNQLELRGRETHLRGFLKQAYELRNAEMTFAKDPLELVKHPTYS